MVRHLIAVATCLVVTIVLSACSTAAGQIGHLQIKAAIQEDVKRFPGLDPRWVTIEYNIHKRVIHDARLALFEQPARTWETATLYVEYRLRRASRVPPMTAAEKMVAYPIPPAELSTIGESYNRNRFFIKQAAPGDELWSGRRAIVLVNRDEEWVSGLPELDNLNWDHRPVGRQNGA